MNCHFFMFSFWPMMDGKMIIMYSFNKRASQNYQSKYCCQTYQLKIGIKICCYILIIIMYQNIKQLFDGVTIRPNDLKYKTTFEYLKPIIKEKIIQVIKTGKSKAGRPITTNIDQIINAMYFITDTGSQYRYVKQHYGIS